MKINLIKKFGHYLLRWDYDKARYKNFAAVKTAISEGSLPRVFRSYWPFVNHVVITKFSLIKV